MFKKTVEFEDFDGNKQRRDFYFHISKVEFLGMAANGNEMHKRIQGLIETKDSSGILHEVRELIKMSVGVRSEDGVRFIKDSEAQSSLLDSPAFDELLMEMATDPQALLEFVRQLIPEKMQKQMLDQMKKQVSENPADEDNRPAYQKETRFPTQKELQKMSKEELAAAMSWRMENNK